MWQGTVGVDANGIVLFDPVALARWRPDLAPGTDLFTELITTDAGDVVLARGLIVPILAIDDGGYDVSIRTVDEASPIDGEVIVENGVFPLLVERDVVVADLAVLRDWRVEVDWTHVAIAPGTYGVTLRGWRRMSPDGKRMDGMGYDFALKPEPALPAVTGDTGRRMRVMNWWDARPAS
jgi:hypothetical protein